MNRIQTLVYVWVVCVTCLHVYAMETQTFMCSFQGDWCGYTQATTDDFDWSKAREETSNSQEPEQNDYICACRNSTNLRPGSLSRLVSPVYKVMTPSLLSLQFKHFKTEGDGSKLIVSVESVTRSLASRDKQPRLRAMSDLKTELPWVLLEGKTDVFGSFQLVFEAEVGYVTESRVAVDDISITMYSYPDHPQASSNFSSSMNSTGTPQQPESENNALTSSTHMTSQDTDDQTYQSHGVQQEKTSDSAGEGVSLCFILAVTSSSLLVIVLVIFIFVAMSLSKRKRRYRRFHFGHDYEEITNKESYNKGSSVSAMAIMKERPQPRLSYHNRHTSFSRIQSLSSCLSRMSPRDSLRSSIYAEITAADLDVDAELSDHGIGNSTTMTTTCTGTWDICSSTDGSVSDVTMPGGSDVTGPSMNKIYPSLSNQGSQNDSGWVENIIYERTSDYSLFDSVGSPFRLDRALKGFGRDKMTTGFKARQRVHTV